METYQIAEWTEHDATFIPPPRRSDLKEERLDGDTVLADPRTGHIHRLNATSAQVWYSCDGRTTTREMAERMTQEYPVDSENARDYVDQLIARFGQSNLLELAK